MIGFMIYLWLDHKSLSNFLSISRKLCWPLLSYLQKLCCWHLISHYRLLNQMLIVSTTKTVRRYIDRSYSWLRKKEGGQNRTAQWSRKGKSKNLGSKRFCFVTQLYLYLKIVVGVHKVFQFKVFNGFKTAFYLLKS